MSRQCQVFILIWQGPGACPGVVVYLLHCCRGGAGRDYYIGVAIVTQLKHNQGVTDRPWFLRFLFYWTRLQLATCLDFWSFKPCLCANQLSWCRIILYQIIPVSLYVCFEIVPSLSHARADLDVVQSQPELRSSSPWLSKSTKILAWLTSGRPQLVMVSHDIRNCGDLPGLNSLLLQERQTWSKRWVRPLKC